ncbi:division initiation protein [Desulfocucumis palustris]|uniref:Division initiation protein n=1 Tax=Desulfocucumis palustris TaxID=1898651 RepID=A0A2L2XDM4_9FIRM|nr:DUF881 domain-containing protein [Desulfocucumis palustris]GBF34447.1 division initiation protein [Desulfocucumis palustris]
MVKTRGYQIVLIVVGLVLGLLLAVQFRVTRDLHAQNNPGMQRTQTLVARVNEAREKRDDLQQKANDLRENLDKAATGPELVDMKEKLMLYRIEAGLSELTGPGVEVTMNDSNMAVQPGEDSNLYVLHDGDVLKVLNELKAAGAEALAINNQRLLSNSEIRCAGPTILTNKNQRLTPPFVITAIGEPDNMINSLKMRRGVVEDLQFWGIQVNIKKLSQVTIPAYSGSIRFEYAVPANEKEAGQ